VKLRPLALAAIFILALTYGLYALRTQSSSTPDFPIRVITATDPQVVIEIPMGATGSDIAQILFAKGVVKSTLSYFRIAVANPRSQKVSPGGHRLTLEISAVQALEQLLDPTRIPNLLKIFEGAWKSEIIDSMTVYGFSKGEIDRAFEALVLPAGFTGAEGLLFPAQYSFPAGTTALQVAQAMVNRFRSEKVGQEILSATGEYSSLQLLTIASIIQSEGDTANFAKVSRVIRNRLEISMRLQMDSTVHFIKKSRGEIFLSTSSTLIKSPYNTYQRYGLPPTPIGNPGIAAMNAALYPVAGDWLYFITVAPGDTRFTASHDQFLEWKILYQKNRKASALRPWLRISCDIQGRSMDWPEKSAT